MMQKTSSSKSGIQAPDANWPLMQQFNDSHAS